jgi:hypothetical protein
LVALGADEIVMTPLAELSPVDPSTNGPFNPTVPVQVAPGELPPTLPVSVEDVAGYLDLAREEAGIPDAASMRRVFLQLATDVRPLALGQVFRARSQIRMLIRKLLQLHQRPPRFWEVRRIVKALSQELLSHDYLITRQEAKALGLAVTFATPEDERSMLALYRDYEDTMQLQEPFNLETELPGPGTKQITFDRAYIESAAGAHIQDSQGVPPCGGGAPGRRGCPAGTAIADGRACRAGWLAVDRCAAVGHTLLLSGSMT